MTMILAASKPPAGQDRVFLMSCSHIQTKPCITASNDPTFPLVGRQSPVRSGIISGQWDASKQNKMCDATTACQSRPALMTAQLHTACSMQLWAACNMQPHCVVCMRSQY